jgi:hypothetical protein
VEWPRGEATACKAVYTGSNPVSTSHGDSTSKVRDQNGTGRLAQGLARFPDTEEVTGSNPVSPTNHVPHHHEGGMAPKAAVPSADKRRSIRADWLTTARVPLHHYPLYGGIGITMVRRLGHVARHLGRRDTDGARPTSTQCAIRPDLHLAGLAVTRRIRAIHKNC